MIVGALLAYLLIGATPALAWGPATHMKLGGDLLGQIGSFRRSSPLCWRGIGAIISSATWPRTWSSPSD
jgi:hypothetical protein